MFYAIVVEDVEKLITVRAMQILIISLFSMFFTQLIKFAIYSIREKKPVWRMLISTGGFPSSHTALCSTLCITLGMFQWHDLGGKLDWSFPVAVVISMIIIHDAMGVRLEASKHAKILNNMTEDLPEEEKYKLGFGKKGQLKEMLGHKGVEVLGGIIVGTIIGVAGFWAFVFIV